MPSTADATQLNVLKLCSQMGLARNDRHQNFEFGNGIKRSDLLRRNEHHWIIAVATENTMASNSSARSLQTLVRRSRRCCACANAVKTIAPVRQFSSTQTRSDEARSTERPRWSYTPENMKAPFQPRVKNPSKAYTVNEDPANLDAMYIKLLGRGGDQVLTEEIKWLAITHKSFDQGRRGFNDRLAFFGRC